MASLSDVLAGLGKGVSTFASLQHQSNLERQAKEERDAQVQREIAQDALRRTLLQLQIDKANKPPAPTFKVVRGKDGAYHAINESTGLDPQGQPVQGWDEPKAGGNRQLRLNDKNEYVSVDPNTGLDLHDKPVRAPQPPPGYTVVQTDQGFTYVPTRPTVQGTGTMPVPAPGGGQLQPKAPESANAAVRNNEALIAEIDQAIEALRKEPGATGLVKGLARSVPVIGPQIMAGLDPAGDAARAALSRVSAGQIHDFYGGNLTKNEVGRSDWAPDPKYGVSANITRLEQGKRKLQAINATIQSQYPQVRGVSDASPQSLTPADLERAKADPGFADWLRKKGYTVP